MKYYINIKGTDEYLFFGYSEADGDIPEEFWLYGDELRYATYFDSVEEAVEHLRLQWATDGCMYDKEELEIHSWDGEGDTCYVEEVG